MVEAGAKEVSEEIMLDAIMYGHEIIKGIVELQEQIVKEVGKPKREVSLHIINEDIEKEVREYGCDKIKEAIYTADKQEREDNLDAVKEEIIANFTEKYPDNLEDIEETIYNITKEIVRSQIINEGVRPDGRGPKDIRNISCEVGLFQRTHGSGLFTRGQTQVLSLIHIL